MSSLTTEKQHQQFPDHISKLPKTNSETPRSKKNLRGRLWQLFGNPFLELDSVLILVNSVETAALQIIQKIQKNNNNKNFLGAAVRCGNSAS